MSNLRTILNAVRRNIRAMSYVQEYKEMHDFLKKQKGTMIKIPIRPNESLCLYDVDGNIYIAEIRKLVAEKHAVVDEFFGTQEQIVAQLKDFDIELHVCSMCGRPFIPDGFLSNDGEEVCSDCFQYYMDVTFPKGWKMVRRRGEASYLYKNPSGFWRESGFFYAAR